MHLNVRHSSSLLPTSKSHRSSSSSSFLSSPFLTSFLHEWIYHPKKRSKVWLIIGSLLLLNLFFFFFFFHHDASNTNVSPPITNPKFTEDATLPPPTSPPSEQSLPPSLPLLPPPSSLLQKEIDLSSVPSSLPQSETKDPSGGVPSSSSSSHHHKHEHEEHHGSREHHEHHQEHHQDLVRSKQITVSILVAVRSTTTANLERLLDSLLLYLMSKKTSSTHSHSHSHSSSPKEREFEIGLEVLIGEVGNFNYGLRRSLLFIEEEWNRRRRKMFYQALKELQLRGDLLDHFKTEGEDEGQGQGEEGETKGGREQTQEKWKLEEKRRKSEVEKSSTNELEDFVLQTKLLSTSFVLVPPSLRIISRSPDDPRSFLPITEFFDFASSSSRGHFVLFLTDSAVPNWSGRSSSSSPSTSSSRGFLSTLISGHLLNPSLGILGPLLVDETGLIYSAGMDFEFGRLPLLDPLSPPSYSYGWKKPPPPPPSDSLSTELNYALPLMRFQGYYHDDSRIFTSTIDPLLERKNITSFSSSPLLVPVLAVPLYGMMIERNLFVRDLRGFDKGSMSWSSEYFYIDLCLRLSLRDSNRDGE
jgi:hypothetical protein